VALRPQDGESPPWIATCSADRTVRFWQPTIGRLVRFARLDSEPLAIAWLPDGSQLAVTSVDGHVRLLDPITLKITQDSAAIEGWAYSLAVHPGGKALAVGGARGELRRVDLR
jgi:WD40 repeat protein